ncbi:MAG: InlB B-repeat-containing protein [Kiritimatiellae bacterium]|nr:InlB B-repeat-containing protein [Kiritimatiellia bacterium]
MVSAGIIYNYNMFTGTGGDFTGNPVAGTTYYVASALPPGLSVVAGAGELAAYTGANVNFNLAETIRGGETPYAFSGTVPTGLTLNPNGMLSGAVATAGSYPFTLRVTDATSPDALTLDAEYTLVVTDPDPLAAQLNLGNAKVGKAVNIALAETISGGVPPYTFAVTASATLPTGFSLTDGVLSGTAAAAGTLTFAITATDALGTTLPASYTLEAVESVGFTDDDPEEPTSGVTVDCLTPDGVYPRTCNQIASSASTVTWDNSWYYVTGNVTLSAGAIVNGKVSLILGDGATLTAQAPMYNAGINVTAGNSLTVYSQSAGSGTLTVTAGMYGAGIGGSQNEIGGIVNIYGGVISAQGGSRGSGIGGGRYGNGGTLTVGGGTVTATGGFSGAGIGGGESGDGGIVTVNAGTVNATGGFYSAGIGAGQNGIGGAVTINGGTVNATGYDGTPGIGAYNTSSQGTLTVGANVEVKAGSSSTLTDADIQNPNGETSISLATAYRYYAFRVIGPTPLAQTASALAAYTGEVAAFDLAETVSGGTAPYTFALKEGESLPAGFTLSDTILTNDAASVGGTFVMTVTDFGSPAQVANFTYTLTVSAPEPLAATQTDLGSVVKGAAFAANLNTRVSGGIPPYTFALAQGSSLPDGFTFEDGVISGAPTASGNYPFTMVVTDGASPEPQVLEATYTIRASANPNQLTQIVSDLPEALAGFEYYQALGQTIEGGKKPYTFTQKEANGCYPPSGIKLNGSALSGIPTDPGRITTVTLVVTDANGLSTEATYNLNVEPGFVQTFTANGVEWKFALFSNPNTHQDRVVICDNNGPAIDRATEGAIVIPSSYGRTSPVACLGDMAFYLCTNLTSVTIPNGVLAIGDMAYASCSNLVSVRIPSSVVQMGDWVFDESGLETVYVDPGDIARVRGLIEGTDYDVSGLEFIEVRDVAFNANYDGGGATTNMMRYGQAVGTLPVLAREHYTFLGWFTAAEGGEQISAETQVTQNATYYAHWAIDTFTVTFAKNDGTDAVVESRRVAYGERVGTLPDDPTRDGYAFFHWWTEPGNNAGTTASALTTVTADVTYYAHWNPRSYTVRFLKNDGTDTVVRNLTTSYGQTLGTLPTPTREGYTLAGWFTAAEDGEQIDSSTLVEGDVDYYAHWTPDSVEDWPEDTSTVAGQTAGEAFEITGDLAGVSAKALADWAKGAGNVAYGDKGDIIPEAFLLNCANTAAAVTAATPVAQEAIKITAITIVNGVPQLTYPATYGNGQVVLQGSANIGASASWHDGKQANDRFFKTVLKP